jgi:hypothetical protein
LNKKELQEVTPTVARAKKGENKKDKIVAKIKNII